MFTSGRKVVVVCVGPRLGGYLSIYLAGLCPSPAPQPRKVFEDHFEAIAILSAPTFSNRYLVALGAHFITTET